MTRTPMTCSIGRWRQALMTIALHGFAATALADEPPAPTPAPSDAVDTAPSPEVTDQCIDRHTQSQHLEREGKFLESRAALLECSAESCPGALRADCVRWLEELQPRIPTLVFRASLAGQALSEVTVYVDGTVVLQRLEGKALELDPGVYRLRFVPPAPAEPVVQQLIVNQGDRLRDVNVEFAAPPSPAAPSAPVVQPPAQRPIPITTYVLGGIGIAAAANGTAWGLSSWSATSDLDATCAPGCDGKLVDVARQRALIADISWGVSAAALIGATVSYFLRPEVTPEGVELDVAIVDHGVLSSVQLTLD